MARKDPKKAQKIREQIKRWDDNWKLNRDQYYLFTEFVFGDQWIPEESKVFQNYKKIPLTMNKLAPLITHLLGEQRQNTPNLQCHPEEQVDVQTAEIRDALVKDISLSSNAKIVYQTAFQQGGAGGFGAYYILTEYDNELSFNQNPTINAVKDPCRCYWDIGASTPCKTDGMFAGFRTRYTRKRFAALHGKKLEKQIPTGLDNSENTFIAIADDDSITVIDHFERTYKNETIYQLSDGAVLTAKEFKALEKIDIEGEEVLLRHGEPVNVARTREVNNSEIKYSQWAGDFELEATDFPSEQLPVIFVDQNSYWDKKGRQVCRPFIKDARDAQKYLNYLATQSAYLLKISRYDQFMVSKQNVRSADTENVWRDPSVIQGGLLYDESPNGNKPEQLRPPELSQSLISQYERALMDIQSSTGMYNTQLGEQGNETSGVAIDARTRRGSYNTFVPFDALNRAIAVGGEIINEMIPRLYDTERSMKLHLKDRGMTDVTINKPVDEYSDERQNDMTKGRYKIRLLPGPSYEGQKQEALDSMQNVLQADRSGQVFPMIADLYVENLPLANNIELKNRLRTLVPPEIVEAGKTGKPLPPKQPQEDPLVQIKQQELQLKMQQAQLEAQAKLQALQVKEHEINMKAHQAGVDLSVQIQAIEAQKEEAKAQLHERELRFQAEMARIHADLHSHHAQNITKILTHQPNHFKAKETENVTK